MFSFKREKFYSTIHKFMYVRDLNLGSTKGTVPSICSSVRFSKISWSSAFWRKKNTCIMRIKSLQLVQHHCYFEVTYWQTLCFQYNWYMWSCVLNSKPHCLYWWTFFDTGTMKCIDLSLTAIHTFRILLNILHKICFMFVCVFFFNKK